MFSVYFSIFRSLCGVFFVWRRGLETFFSSCHDEKAATVVLPSIGTGRNFIRVPPAFAVHSPGLLKRNDTLSVKQ
jgi:hypothetical protein